MGSMRADGLEGNRTGNVGVILGSYGVVIRRQWRDPASIVGMRVSVVIVLSADATGDHLERMCLHSWHGRACSMGIRARPDAGAPDAHGFDLRCGGASVATTSRERVATRAERIGLPDHPRERAHLILLRAKTESRILSPSWGPFRPQCQK